MKITQLRKLIREELQNNISEKRTVWKSSEYEEMHSSMLTLLDLIDYLENSEEKEKILDALLTLQGVLDKEGLMQIN